MTTNKSVFFYASATLGIQTYLSEKLFNVILKCQGVENVHDKHDEKRPKLDVSIWDRVWKKT